MANPKEKNEAPAVTTYADYEVIRPPNRLKKAVVRVREKEPEPDPIVRAEEALAELSRNFSEWMKSECDRLDTARRGIKESGFTPTTRDELFRACHDIKGEAATFGYPLVAPVAESLCRLIEHCPEESIPMVLIDQHVDGIRAIAQKNARSNSDQTADVLARRLRQVTDEFLVYANRHRPEYLDGIVAPPLVPGCEAE